MLISEERKSWNSMWNRSNWLIALRRLSRSDKAQSTFRDFPKTRRLFFVFLRAAKWPERDQEENSFPQRNLIKLTSGSKNHKTLRSARERKNKKVKRKVFSVSVSARLNAINSINLHVCFSFLFLYCFVWGGFKREKKSVARAKS